MRLTITIEILRALGCLLHMSLDMGLQKKTRSRMYLVLEGSIRQFQQIIKLTLIKTTREPSNPIGQDPCAKASTTRTINSPSAQNEFRKPTLSNAGKKLDTQL